MRTGSSMKTFVCPKVEMNVGCWGFFDVNENKIKILKDLRRRTSGEGWSRSRSGNFRVALLRQVGSDPTKERPVISCVSAL